MPSRDLTDVTLVSEDHDGPDDEDEDQDEHEHEDEEKSQTFMNSFQRFILSALTKITLLLTS